MKKIHFAAFGAALLVVALSLLRCTNKTSQDIITPDHYHKDQSLSGFINPLDSLGIIHNILLDSIYNRVVSQVDSFESINQKAELIRNAAVSCYFEMFNTDTASLINQINFAYDSVLIYSSGPTTAPNDNLSITQMALLRSNHSNRVVNYLDTLTYYLTFPPASLSLLLDKIYIYDITINNDSLLSASEKNYLFGVSSIAKHSSIYWCSGNNFMKWRELDSPNGPVYENASLGTVEWISTGLGALSADVGGFASMYSDVFLYGTRRQKFLGLMAISAISGVTFYGLYESWQLY